MTIQTIDFLGEIRETMYGNKRIPQLSTGAVRFRVTGQKDKLFLIADQYIPPIANNLIAEGRAYKFGDKEDLFMVTRLTLKRRNMGDTEVIAEYEASI